MFIVKEIKKITNAKLINGIETCKIEKFNVSAKNHYKNEFYIPIFWREDRQQYIMDAVKSGAIGYIISKNYEREKEIIRESIKINPNIIILEVEDINESIYEMAMYKRNENINIPIIAVTGSVGKTSTCEMIASIIRKEKHVLADSGNNNVKQLLSWLLLDIEDYEIAVLEAGIGRKDVMEPISKLLMPSIAVINNIGTAHIEKLGSKENILKEKMKLITHMKDEKIVFLNDDDAMLREVKLDSSYKVNRYSLSEAKNIIQNENSICFETNVYGENTKFNLNAYGNHSVLNAICAIKIGELLNIDKEDIINGINDYTSVDRRFKIIKENNYTIIDDTYNASLDSMRAGLTSADKLTAKRKLAILGEMLELGEYSKELHSQVGEVFKDVNFDILLTQGENTEYICKTAKKYMKDKTIINFKTQEELMSYLLDTIEAGDLIYLKASKKMKFNNIVEILLEKSKNIVI